MCKLTPGATLKVRSVRHLSHPRTQRLDWSFQSRANKIPSSTRPKCGFGIRTSRASSSPFASDRGLSTPEMTADRAFTSLENLACCTLWWLESCSSPSAKPCRVPAPPLNHKGSPRFPVDFGILDLEDVISAARAPVFPGQLADFFQRGLRGVRQKDPGDPQVAWVVLEINGVHAGLYV
jgi:hypothetical protein